MEWQLTIVAIAIAVAVTYLSRQIWRTWFTRSAGCGGGCGCAASKGSPKGTSLIPAEQLTLRRRSS